MDLFEPVREFEKRVAEFTGFKYGVAVESCSAAIFLGLVHYYGRWNSDKIVDIPSKTYPSVPSAIVNAGYKVKWMDYDWQKEGYYRLGILPIYDCAIMINHNMQAMFPENSLVCVSFHHKKMLPIGRGGMILTNDTEAAKWLSCARHDGRHDKVDLKDDVIEIPGWNMLLTPEQASRGIALMNNLKDENKCPYQEYPDLKDMPAWKDNE